MFLTPASVLTDLFNSLALSFGPLFCLSPMLTVFIASFLRSFKSMYACPKLKPSNSACVETCYASNSLICNSDSKLYAR